MCNIPGFGGGGPSSEETGLEAQESGLSKTLQANYGTTFGDEMDTLKMLNSTVQRISSGQTGPGFSESELAAKTSQIVNQAAAQARNTEQAVADAGAGQNFGSTASGRTSAIRQQLNEEALSGAETAKSNALTNLTTQNYQQGRENAIRTAAAQEALAGQYGSAASRSLSGTLQANQTAFGQAEKIQQQQMEKGSLIGGLLKTGLGLGLKAVTGGIAGGGGFLDTIKGAAGALTGQDYLSNPSPDQYAGQEGATGA